MADRFYKNSKGVFVPSGTTVLLKPYLAKWAANCAVDYLFGIADGLYNDPELDTDPYAYVSHPLDFEQARTAYQRESTEAAEYGTYIHTLCEYSLRECLRVESPHEMTNKFMAGLWKWVEKHDIRPIVMEHEVVTNTYGGRLDMVCEMDGVVTLVDFKTGKGSYYDNWKYQAAGYRQAYNELLETKEVAKYCHRRDRSEFNAKESQRLLAILRKNQIQNHGILKFNKETMKVNYKDFTSYQATRTIKTGPRLPDGKLPTEKYTRTYEDDRNTFNCLVQLWWLMERGGL